MTSLSHWRITHAVVAVLTLVGAAAGGPAVGATSPYATEVVAASGPFGGAPYDDPNAMLGEPTARFYEQPFLPFTPGGLSRTKIVQAATNLAADQATKVLTTLGNADSSVIVKFDHAVEDDPMNPFGIDLLVFGNEFFQAGGIVTDATNMNTLDITGGPFVEPVTVSVSPGFQGLAGEVESDPQTWRWHEYTDGPFADAMFPTQGFMWDHDAAAWTDEPMDFTRPVDPALFDTIAAGGLSAADAIDLYDGSGGGAGFDLLESGFDWIQYVQVQGAGGEIDAFADVAPVPEPTSVALLAVGSLIALRRRWRPYC